MTAKYDHAEWVKRYTRMREIAERVSQMRMDRARKACREAGLDDKIIGIHVHNALVSAEWGKPWPEVDYQKCRLSRWLMDRSHEGFRIVEKWDARVR